MATVNERNIGPNGQADLKFVDDTLDNIPCNNGGLLWQFKNHLFHPITVIYGIMDVTDAGSQRYETFIVPGHQIVSIACTQSTSGHPVQIRKVWGYANTDYVPSDLNNPWESLLILKALNGSRELYNLNERRMNVTIRKGNGQRELRAIGPKSEWGVSFPFKPDWEVLVATWAL